MDTYQAQDGSNRTSLNLLQRTLHYAAERCALELG